jgi:hypothetical protein
MMKAEARVVPRGQVLAAKTRFSVPLGRNFFAAGEESKGVILSEAQRSEESAFPCATR